jgi:uncharacterized protein (DUF697 family)
MNKKPPKSKNAKKSTLKKASAKSVPSRPSAPKKPKSVTLSVYEQRQLQEIESWKNQEPSVVDKTLGIVIEPLAAMVRKVVPEAALMGALQMARKLSTMTIDTEDVIREAAVKKVSDLRTKDLALSDRLAEEVHNWGIGLAAAEGAGTGFFGIFGAPVDVPALVTLSLRTIEKIGICYGYECKTKEDEDFIMGILAAAGANSIEEKLGALMAIRAVETVLIKQTWKKMAENAAKNQIGKESVIIGLRALAKQLSINITKRKALAAIPYIGALIGGSMNAWYVRDIGWAARRVFQERWLRENGKIIDV